MKAKQIVTALALVAGLSISSFAQHLHHEGGAKNPGTMIEMLGTPTFEKSVEGLQIRVWLITQDEHRKMMGESADTARHADMHKPKDDGKMMHEGMSMHGMMHSRHGAEHSGATKSMFEGTHHVMAVVTDEKTGEPVENASVHFHIMYPSGKTDMATLDPMQGCVGGSLSLDEMGEYALHVTVKAGKKTVTTQFTCTVE